MPKLNLIKLIVSVVLCQGAGLVGAVFTTPAITGWYSLIEKPGFTPPNWIFAPVWTALFLLMGVSLYFIWNQGLEKKKVRTAVLVFSFQLALNVLWSVIFFGWQSPFFAFLEIIVLWFAILATIISFYQISKTAGLLLLPYIFWVTLAAFLNFFIWQLN